MGIRTHRGPLIASGIILGAGLGGFMDGIVFHQILQMHNMMSGVRPVTDLVSAKVNMTWDGYFHLAVWIMTAIGLVMLFRAGRRTDVPWSGKTLLGSAALGWGLFNFVEGVVDHLILGIHHVDEYALNHAPADLAFLASGIVLMLLGGFLIHAGRVEVLPRGHGGRDTFAAA